MKHYFLQAVFLTITSVLIQSCNDATIDPSLTDYPLELTVTSENSTAELNWTELTVSSFEEYIIVRSIDSIPDSAEPELIGNAIVIERIDKSEVTEFIDFAPPISQTVYYKVFGKIDGRFLATPTVRIDLSFQIIELRADISEIDHVKSEIVAYDRSSQILFVYNYDTEKIRIQKYITLNNPVIRLGEFNGVEEIYVADQNSVIYIYDRATLGLSSQSDLFSSARNFIYDEGRFVIASINSTISVMNRSTLQIVDTENGIANQRSLHFGVRNGNELEVLEIGFNEVVKYILEGNNLRRVDSNSDFPGGSQLISAGRPDGREFVINSTGRIIDNDLDLVTRLEDGNQFYNQIAYTEDGLKLFTAGFQGNDFKLKFFDVENEYALIAENTIGLSPQKMFSDDQHAYLMSIVFLNGGVRTLISNYKIP